MESPGEDVLAGGRKEITPHVVLSHPRPAGQESSISARVAISHSAVVRARRRVTCRAPLRTPGSGPRARLAALFVFTTRASDNALLRYLTSMLSLAAGT